MARPTSRLVPRRAASQQAHEPIELNHAWRADATVAAVPHTRRAACVAYARAEAGVCARMHFIVPGRGRPRGMAFAQSAARTQS
eukprot:COSAG04_NODE_10359_length_784_cov_0.849635_1_plen_83_part_10